MMIEWRRYIFLFSAIRRKEIQRRNPSSVDMKCIHVTKRSVCLDAKDTEKRSVE
jgi:hypothetical protein